MQTNQNQGGQANGRAPRWAALIDDEIVWAPHQRVAGQVLLDQAGEGNKILVRDHNSPNDVILGESDQIDLAAGNVFYTLDKSEVQPREACHEPPKLAYVVDDRFEVATHANQTGATIRSLFNVPGDRRLIRDYESRQDDDVEPGDAAKFGDCPVFYTREIEHKLRITVNSRIFTDKDGVKPEMTGEAIAALVYPQNAADTTVRELSPEAREIPLDKKVHIRGGEVFEVTRKNVTGGFTNDRVDRELKQLRDAKQEVTPGEKPAAVIYHGLRVKPGGPVATSDVLVLVPSGYPGQMLDGAYLPENSPLIGRVKGEPQDARVTANGITWRQISYHPHNGGGGPKWNPGIHGFHTYISELISWLQDLR
jgi:hypothetical protein